LEGQPQASLVFVGEGPGAEEDATGAVCGRAGQLLDNSLQRSTGREDVYIAKHRQVPAPLTRTPEATS